MNINSFFEFFKEYLLKNFFPRYKKFLYYLEFPFNHRLDNTNNQTENYIGGTIPKSYKRKFRTKKGIINQIYYKGNGWIKNKKINKHNDSPYMLLIQRINQLINYI